MATFAPPEMDMGRYRLIPHQGVTGSKMIEGTPEQAVQFAEELSLIHGCEVMVTVLGEGNVPTIIKSVIKEKAVRVTIHGPNLEDQSQGSFHVHAADCKDNDREVKLNGSIRPMTIGAQSVMDIVDFVYPADQFEDRQRNLDAYIADFHIEGCLKALPKQTTQPKEDAVSTMAPEPRVKNGENTEVVTDPAQSTVLNDEQKAELAKTKTDHKDNGTSKAKKATAAKSTTKKDAPKGVKKNDCGVALSAIRKELAVPWDGPLDPDVYIAHVERAIAKAKEAIALARKMQKEAAE